MGRNEFVGFLATISATTALGIDMILPAFGQVREAFGLPDDSTQVALTVTMYFLGLSTAQVLYGPLADRFGRKPVLLGGLGLYVVAALASGFAPNLTVLLISRLIWGIGAAGPRVLMMAIARDSYAGDRLAQVMSLAQAIFMIVPALAPLIGQGVTAAGGWRLTFAAPVIPATALVLWAVLRLEETPAARGPPTSDVRGHRRRGASRVLQSDHAVVRAGRHVRLRLVRVVPVIDRGPLRSGLRPGHPVPPHVRGHEHVHGKP